MKFILKRLFLGLFLIALAAGVLLVSDLKSRRGAKTRTHTGQTPGAKVFRLAILQHAAQPVLDDGVRGMITGLAEKGFTEGNNISIRHFNAAGDLPTATAIAREITDGKYDLVLTASTASMQAVANANKAGKTRHVFGLVSDPYGAGVGINRDNHLDHPPQLAGYGTMQPVEDCFRLARQMFPALKNVGTVWNTTEANSEAQLKVARKIADELGITLLEATVDNSSGVLDAANAVVSRGAEALWVCGDVTVLTSFDSMITAGKRGHVPVFTVIPPHAERGALFDLGANYFEVGRLTGELAGEVLEGRDMTKIPIDNVVPEVLVMNKLALGGLKDTWRFPPDVLKRATTVIDETGKHDIAPATEPVRPAAPHLSLPRPPPGKVFRLGLAYFAPDQAIDSTMNGLFSGLKELGFEEGRNLAITRTHAQGEMLNIPGLIQNLDQGDADLLVTFTTPLLQAACFGVKKKPVVFACVTDPIAAGAGKSWTDHHPHVTGVGSFPPLEDTMNLIARLVPGIRSLGTLYNSGEANSVKVISVLRPLARSKGIELVELTAASTSEMLQAAQGLVSRSVQAIYIPSDNTAYQAFDAIIKVADAAGLPVINDDVDYLARGPIAASGPGFFESGKAAAPYVARILLGEKPADLPMTNVSVNVTRLNLEKARKLNLTIPADLVREIEAKPKAAATSSTRPAAAPLSRKWKIHVVELNDVPAIEESRKGFLLGLEEAGLVRGRDYEVKILNAQGDIATVNSMVDAAVAEGSDLLGAISTISLQSAIRKVRDRPIIFAQVTDPVKAGAGRSLTDHLPNVTGSTPLSDHDKMVQVLRRCLPAARRVGTLFNPSEDNSVIQKDGLVAAGRKAGLEVELIGVNTTSEINNGAVALCQRSLDAICQISDNLTSAGFATIANAARQARLPLFCYQTPQAQSGGLVAVARDFLDAGRVSGNLAARVMRGENPGAIPFEVVTHTRLVVNLKAAKDLGITLPADLVKEADGVVDDSGYRERTVQTSPPAATNARAAAASAPAAKNAKPLARTWRVQLVNYNESAAAEDVLRGITEGLQAAQLVPGRDYTLRHRSAQGDMATLNSIFDLTAGEGADLFLIVSTPTLQIALKKVRNIPIVFTFVANPIIAGAGRSYTDHLPHVTGISSLGAFAEMAALIQTHFPAYKRVGTLFCPAEINSVHNKDSFTREAAARGITVEAVPVNTASDIPEGAAALSGRPIDAIAQIMDNLTAAGFVPIGRAAQRAKLPLFSFNSSTLTQGAAVVVSRDFYHGGTEAAALAARVMRGENPARIPFSYITKTRTMVNLANASTLGMTIPPALIKKADEVVRE